jgi:hypothetical protein
MPIKTMKILLTPSFRFTAEKLGYDLELDDVNEDAILFEQGFGTTELEVKSGEKFVISSNFDKGRISLENAKYKLVTNDYEGDDFEEDEYEAYDQECLTLGQGVYYLHPDGVTIEKVSDAEEDEDTFDLEDSDETYDPNIEEIWNAVTDSAKKRFDYPTFAKEFDEIDTSISENILFTTIVNFASGESKESTASKLFSQILMTGYLWEKSDIDSFVKDKEDLFKLEIYLTELATSMLENGQHPLTVLANIKQLIP